MPSFSLLRQCQTVFLFWGRGGWEEGGTTLAFGIFEERVLLESVPGSSVRRGADLGKMKLFAFLRYFPYLKDQCKCRGSV